MEELEAKLDRLLSSPDGMKRVEELMAAFTADKPAPKEEPAPTDGMPDLAALMKLMPLLGQLNAPDDNAALLRALRPHLQDGRQKRLDEAEKLLQMMKLMPLIKEFGKGEAHEGE